MSCFIHNNYQSVIYLLVLFTTASETLCLYSSENSTLISAFIYTALSNKLALGCSVGSTDLISGTICLISPVISDVDKTASVLCVLIHFLVSVNIKHSSFVFFIPGPVWSLYLPALHVHGLDSVYLHSISPPGNKGPDLW